jgi:hypothetical protein
MAKRTHDVVATIGTYRDKATGEEKKRRLNIGSVFTDETNGQLSIKLDSVPVDPEWSGWAAIFPINPDYQPRR